MDSLSLNLASLQGADGEPEGAKACLQLLLLLPPQSARCPLCGRAHPRRSINRAHPWIGTFGLARLAPALEMEARRSGFPTIRYADGRAFACSEDEQACWDQAEARWSAAQGGEV